MSAIPPKADIAKRRCQSALCQKRLWAGAANCGLFDHL